MSCRENLSLKAAAEMLWLIGEYSNDLAQNADIVDAALRAHLCDRPAQQQGRHEYAFVCLAHARTHHKL